MNGLILASWRDCVFRDAFCLERDVSEDGRVVTKDGLGGAAQLCEDSSRLGAEVCKTNATAVKRRSGEGVGDARTIFSCGLKTDEPDALMLGGRWQHMKRGQEKQGIPASRAHLPGEAKRSN